MEEITKLSRFSMYVLWIKSITPTERLFYIDLCARSDEKRFIKTSAHELSLMYEISKRNILKRLNSLEKNGLIDTYRKKDGSLLIYFQKELD